MRTVCLVALCTGVLVGCNSSTPTAPTPPTPPVVVSPLPPVSAIVAMSVLGNQWIATTSAPVQMIARVYTRISSGDAPGEYVDDTEHVEWSVDSPTVAQVDRHGRVTPIASGTVRVTARLGDRSGINTIRVLPDYAGTWSGEYRISACTGAQDFRTCGRLMVNIIDGQPARYPFTLVLSQDRDQVSGTLTDSNGQRGYPVSGFVRLSGALVLEATVLQEGLESLRIINFVTTANAPSTQLSGGFTRIAPSRGLGDLLFTMRTEHEFIAASRSS